MRASRRWSAACWVAWLGASCGAPGNRPVEGADDLLGLTVALDAFSDEAPRVRSVSFAWTSGAAAAPPAEDPPADAAEERPAPHADPALGEPLDAGLPLLFDFGAGEAPFDDGIAPLHRGTPGRRGFSDTVISLTWRQRINSSLGWFATAALAREQDLALIDGFSTARFTFAVLGVSVSY